MVIGLGSMTSGFFMCTINEPVLSTLATNLEREYKIKTLGEESLRIEEDLKFKEKQSDGKDWRAWLKEGSFYVHGIVYMLVRIAVNVTMTMQPFYLENALGFSATKEQPTPVALAAVPLGSYITSLIFSIWFQQPMTRCLRNRMYPMLVAIVIILCTSIPLKFLPGID